ncbi:FOG: Transposon-encoded proteins with TYA, reverse transcriptase, integrase domains in various combinations [Phaffia rhodozyma]|uniref:FOG: Transposon-encoded proteins with TYA, reverse transcriptase, integrase domains in various combinations n=1 Tax=Phaffia rhodozyma TaxID=264483 RepID=A0A0F7SF14_PHARH|nr:FOG: Transposon-encoded proteins with TYA, reverse transcriptase, integrase domains in various combinations [Phaffia rhodozyma]
MEFTLTIGQKSSPSVSPIELYTDSDYAEDKASRKSVTGIMIYVFGALVYWKSKRIPSITKSSWESEYIALSNGASQVVWVRSLLHQLGYSVPTIVAKTDNQGAIASVRSGQLHNKTKHIDVPYKYARDMYRQGILDLGWVKTKDLPADLLTKPLPRETFEYLRDKGGLGGRVGARELTPEVKQEVEDGG